MNQKLRNPILILTGALLTGFLWRVRGTGGWGAAWGLMTVGLGFTLFLAAAAQKKQGPSLRLIALAALSFLFTAPAWGTLLTQITGVLKGSVIGEGADDILISPAVGASFMLLMGFGIPALFGVMLGRCFSDKAWKWRDYIAVLAVFLIAVYGAKASVSHLFVRWLEPQAVEAFRTGIAREDLGKSVYSVYMAHFNAESWAKKIYGGRHYYALVSAVSAALGSLASILAARFIVKDRYAAKTDAFVCGAFALAITAADLFFFFDAGGYRMAQSFSLPETFAAWSLWEFFTGFLAGGAVTAYILKTVPKEDTRETLLQKLPPKPFAAFSFLLCGVFMIGVNIVRPVLRRFSDTKALIPAVIVSVLFALAVCLLLAKLYGFDFGKADLRRAYPAACLFFITYIVIAYLFIAPAEKQEFRNLSMLHNILVLISFFAAAAVCVMQIKKKDAA